MTLFGKRVEGTSRTELERIIGSKKIRIKDEKGKSQEVGVGDFKKNLYETVKKRGGVISPDTFRKDVLEKKFGIKGTKKDVGIRERLADKYYSKK